jgi:hypothetical protein
MSTVAPIFAHLPGWGFAGLALQLNTVLLLAGLVAFSGGLLVLVFTRWGHVKPLAKCAALSVFAHLLLLASACGIRLFNEPPGPFREQVIRLSMLDDGELLPKAEPREPAAVPEDLPMAPADAPLPTPELVADEVPEPPRVPDAVDSPAPPPELAAALLEAAPPAVPPELLPSPPLDVPAPAELGQSPPVPEPLPPPSIPEPQRLPLAESPPTPTFRISDQASKRLAAQNDDLQRLIDMALPLPSADALADTQDRTDAAENTADDEAAAPADSPLGAKESWLPVPPADAAAWQLASSAATAPARELPDSYRSRSVQQRQAMLTAGGGNQFTEAAVQAAMQWMSANQGEDGRWDCSLHGGGREMQTLGHDRGGAGAEADTAITGLAILAYLGAGQTHADGLHAASVRRGLEFLVRTQAADGNLAGNAELFARMYCHGMATLALSEAYGMTGDSGLRPYLERALGYTVRAQHPVTGGWRYQPGDDGDTSQLGWQLMALHSAQLAGLPIPAATRAGMIRFLNSVTTGPQRGLASYRPRTSPSRTMTAEALVCRMFLGVKQEEAAIREAVAYLLQETPQGGPFNEYYWYYATLALFQLQGDGWEAWNGALQQRLLESQETSGTLAGSWPTNTVWGGYGGRVYTTAMNALCLEVYYRHLPLYATSDAGR